MKYVKPSSVNSNVYESYSIKEFMINKTAQTVNVVLQHCYLNSDSIIDIEYSTHTIMNINELIVDPSWNGESSPPKPMDFDIQNPITWGVLSWDDIPKIINPNKLFASKLITTIESENINVERLIIEELITLKKLPQMSEGWQIR